jgi:hypothetical protein
MLWDHLKFEHYAGYWKNGKKNGLGQEETYEMVSHNIYESKAISYGIFRNGVFKGRGSIEEEQKDDVQ